MITLLRIRLWYVCKLHDIQVRMVREQEIHKQRLVAATMLSCRIDRDSKEI